MREGWCCERENFPRTRRSGSRLSWPTLAKAKYGWVSSVREEIGYSLRVVQQPKIVGCCPEIPDFTVRRCCVVTPVDILAVEVASIHVGVWERRDSRRCETRVWRFVDVNDLVSCDVYTQPLSLWLLWILFDQCSFQLLVNKRGKTVLPAQSWPS